jgi:hypothetical protein
MGILQSVRPRRPARGPSSSALAVMRSVVPKPSVNPAVDWREEMQRLGLPPLFAHPPGQVGGGAQLPEAGILPH